MPEHSRGNDRPSGPLDTQVLDAIDAAVMAREGRKEGGEVRFRCPAPGHEDLHPSARWNRTKAVWRCDACGAGAGAIGLAKLLGLSVPEREPDGLTLERLAEAKGLPADVLKDFGVRNGVDGFDRRPCVDILYIDEQGEVTATRKRLRLQAEPRFKWRPGSKATLYGRSRLDHARKAGQVLVLEGESDTWTAWNAGLPAVSVPGAGTWREEWARKLSGIANVYLWREPDSGGDTLIGKAISDLPDASIIEAPAGIKDLSDLWVACGYDVAAFRERVTELVKAAWPAAQIREEALSREARDAFILAQPLLDNPNLVDEIKAAIQGSGYVGDLRPPLLAYFGLTSRLLERPLNLGYFAQSAAGKSKAVETALLFMPESAYYLLKSGSERALIFNDADFEHKIVVVAEADALPEEGPAATAIRSLAADNCMEYEIVEKGESGKHEVRKVQKPGPTGLITTSTRSLPPQMSTRLLTVPIPDTKGQVRAILRAHAASVNGQQPAVEAEALVALQRWLELAGDHEVTVPFGHHLANAVPAELVRMNRDFRQLLTVIQAVALLHQRQRERDNRGRIIATLADYAIARDVLDEVFTATSSGGVTPAMRQTVEAVEELYQDGVPVGIPALAEHLGLGKDTVRWRVRAALRGDFLVNEETRKGRPSRLKPGTVLPDDRSALPACDALLSMCTDSPESTSRLRDPSVDASAPIWENGDLTPEEDANTPISHLLRTSFAPPAEGPPRRGDEQVRKSASSYPPDPPLPDGTDSSEEGGREPAKSDPGDRQHMDGETTNRSTKEVVTFYTSDELCEGCGMGRYWRQGSAWGCAMCAPRLDVPAPEDGAA